jgi:hypothetical protein
MRIGENENKESEESKTDDAFVGFPFLDLF